MNLVEILQNKFQKILNFGRDGEDKREPVARFLRTYSIFLIDHMQKEEQFFEKAEKEILSREEEQEMFEQFQSISAITEKVTSLLEDISYLESQDWVK